MSHPIQWAQQLLYILSIVCFCFSHFKRKKKPSGAWWKAEESLWSLYSVSERDRMIEEPLKIKHLWLSHGRRNIIHAASAAAAVTAAVATITATTAAASSSFLNSLLLNKQNNYDYLGMTHESIAQF